MNPTRTAMAAVRKHVDWITRRKSPKKCTKNTWKQHFPFIDIRQIFQLQVPICGTRHQRAGEGIAPCELEFEFPAKRYISITKVAYINVDCHVALNPPTA
jgi:hypothetical protein